MPAQDSGTAPDMTANGLCENKPEFADPDPHDSPRLPSGQDVWSVKGAMFALYKTVSDQGRLEFDVAPIAPGGVALVENYKARAWLIGRRRRARNGSLGRAGRWLSSHLLLD